MSDLLRVEDLWVRFPKRGGGMVEAVRGISFSVGRERVGIVGESGSGKSMTGRAILRLVRPPGEATARLEVMRRDPAWLEEASIDAMLACHSAVESFSVP